MGRKVRNDWVHPQGKNGERYKPLFPGKYYEERANEFMKKANQEGLQEAIDYCGNPPDINNFMPDWSENEKTHFMMYENTSEGTPISPAFETPEKLAQWLVDNNASAFGSETASYEAWLNICKGEWAPSMLFTPQTGLVNGVEASILI
jgi:hypothetical protein